MKKNNLLAILVFIVTLIIVFLIVSPALNGITNFDSVNFNSNLVFFFGPIVVVGGLVFLFLIFRAFWLWYWKIDKIVNLLEKIEKNTRKPGAGESREN